MGKKKGGLPKDLKNHADIGKWKAATTWVRPRDDVEAVEKELTELFNMYVAATTSTTSLRLLQRTNCCTALRPRAQVQEMRC